ncbi:C4-dicarboxylate ABC transporter [Arachidicoccus ginsenosidimutans]|uniref:dicarboxylate/amino acid:cation symporter n=1 Tax=Arachidicoccus sp. BS20 TaxID=1850526 RepID=UPI0007F0F7E1|nr:cation:dicarboxylase symporter family transporter [Arachidicoccus sp. BS20]ANI88554.1 C4-dicarboxylate ABC transporter [Arachidicoccus sp. BS20]
MKTSKNKLTLYIFIAMLIGALVGYLVFLYLPKEKIPSFTTYANVLTVVFLRLIQMVISPLVFCTLTVGIAKLGDLKAVGRVGGKAMLWFVSASVVSLFVGLLIVNITQPGTGIHINNVNSDDAKSIISHTQEFSATGFINHLVPKSVIEAMASNEILQIVVFAIFLGVALASLGERANPVIKIIDTFSHAILKMVNYVMYFAPLGVLGSIAATMAVNGPSVFLFYARYLFWFLLAVLILWLILMTVGFIVLRKRLFDLLKLIIQPMIVAFSTTSSEAVFPVLTEKLEKFGCNEKIVSFVLPLGYSFNLDGSMINMTFASLAIAQAYHIHIDLPTQITMLFVLMLTSKGIAGVPRAALVVVAATCSMFHIPPEGIALILPIDHFCDMLRTMTNVVGNAFSTASVSKWEKELKTEN